MTLLAVAGLFVMLLVPYYLMCCIILAVESHRLAPPDYRNSSPACHSPDLGIRAVATVDSRRAASSTDTVIRFSVNEVSQETADSIESEIDLGPGDLGRHRSPTPRP
ncbi:hypothetical protein [Rhodococcus sp. B50]|uniref:hypothetical protein n=1 Tax=Rhodococcus sp. B50 TaxID=2682847 RepID=UPI001BD5206D|nr:hypothetical protein [Rhodococcus sp. B50]MBS9376508.1 hypothetical protein [Rhodococcus sp. B50]